ncbi:phage integrase SAM-like domain and Arm DNA-binding domain-containing protein [Chryseobacterium sp.]|uniref:phage integrase SAM-like domain and Arm DNA-binding domain-containing protein n=1 Tax=Chryseobacterium sp. TaxID=1871047 RepID=UPI0031D2DF0F
MLEQSYGLNFFLKSPKNKKQAKRLIYIRISVDGVAKESSTKKKWVADRWSQQDERAIGLKEDARELNYFLDSLTTKVNSFRTGFLNQERPVSAVDLIDYVNGKYKHRNKVLEEFQEHNEEVAALVKQGDYSEGTLERYTTARSHVKEFIRFKYKVDDLPFAALNYEFVKNYNHYLRTVRNCSNNTSLKYISNFKKNCTESSR